MANIKQRAGSVRVRIGGNTQETATLVASIADGKAIEKDKGSATNPTQTPALLFTAEIIYMLANISALANVKWYLGVPFNDTANLRLQIAEVGQAILGDNLIGLQAGNEPDLYAAYVSFRALSPCVSVFCSSVASQSWTSTGHVLAIRLFWRIWRLGAGHQ